MRTLRHLILAAALASTATAFGQTVPAPEDAATSTAPAKKKVALVRLSNTLSERPQGFRFSLFDMGAGKAPALSTLITTLNKAAKDPAVSAVVLDLNAFSLSLSQAQEVGALIQNVRKGQKLVVVYASDYDTATYVLASHASVVVMSENGNILMPGVSLQMLFFRGLLDKISVAPDFVQVGKYKGAEEPFMRTEASPEYKAEIDGLVDGMFQQIKRTVADNRPNMEPAEVARAIDEGWLTGKRARELKLIDHTMSRDKLDAWLEDSLGGKTEMVKDYGSPKKKSLDMDSPLAIFQLLSPPAKARSSSPAVAVVYAVGTIMPDQPDGLDSDDGNVTPTLMRKAFDKALKDEQVKAIVLRVDSPGGSATASDEIWQIVRDAGARKPVTVSQGRLAASGGYYISCAGKSITADPATITGSIGVVGGKLVMKGMLDKVGVNVQTVSRGQHANLFSFTSTFSDEERAFVKKTMTETYDLFKKRVADGRAGKIKEVEDVAGGKLFTGEAALKAGLVDKVGTLSDVVLTAAKDAGIDKNYQILVYPEAKTLSDVFREGFTVDASLPLELSAALKAAPPSYRREIIRMLDMVRCMQSERVMMALPGLVEGGR